MSVFIAYSDEAGVGDDKGEFLVAGFVADASEWPWFDRAWQERVLDGPPEIPELHMTEMRSPSWRQAHGVSYNEAERRIDAAVDCVLSSGFLYAVGSVILQSDLKELVTAKFANQGKAMELAEPDYFCHLAFFYVTLNAVREYFPSAEKVNFAFSEKSATITRNLKAMATEAAVFMEQVDPDIAGLMGAILPASPKNALPLQAADTICWHLQRYYRDRRLGRAIHRTDERRMWYLLKEQNGNLHLWQRDALTQLADRLEKHFSPHDPVPPKIVLV